jgi:F-type H+-transporting ATPase subunit delta
MQNPRLAGRYAKSLLDIAQEQNTLDAVTNDMRVIRKACLSNHDLRLLLKSPVIKADKKHAILHAIFGEKIQRVTMVFLNLLVSKGREVYLSEIAEAYETQHKELKNIKTVHLTTAVAIDENLRKTILDKVTDSIQNDGSIELHTIVNEHLIGGFTLEMGDKLFDASIRRDLNDIKAQFTQNLYRMKM